MPGWREEAAEEDLERRVASEVAFSGRHVYREIYDKAVAMKKEGRADDEIRKELDTGPRETPTPDRDLSPKALEALARNARERRLVERELSLIRKRAIEDALAGIRPRGSIS